jgi:O-acetyl-ADP-ribose deacetylase (regulator of RNase III)
MNERIKLLALQAGGVPPHYTNTNNPVDFPKNISMLKHTKGNLLNLAEAGEFDIVVQGCNCFNTMGGGIAREVRERYPEVALVDAVTKCGDYTKLGTWTSEVVIRKNGTVEFTVINAYTQYNMSRGTDVFEYTAFQLILEKLLFAFGNLRIGLPYIGMGLAGGDKFMIMTMINAFAEQVAERGGSVTLVEFG